MVDRSNDGAWSALWVAASVQPRRSGHGAVRSAVGLNVYDKRQAINAVREGFVQQFELTAAQAELDALRRRMAAAAEANRALQ